MIQKHYRLYCPVCGTFWEDGGYLINCPNGCTSLLRTSYDEKRLIIHNHSGLFRYSSWLPVCSTLETQALPVCYQSCNLAEELGLSSLWISLSGYWPEKGSHVISGSFKEFEAFPTMVRLQESGGGVVVVASAGNTGRAFAQVSAETGLPAIIIVPAHAADRIYTTVPARNLFLITVDGDYTDAIHAGSLLSSLPGLVAEGGAKNVARRDGMGIVMVEGTRVIGQIPDWYIQGVGSGTGGIAAWEAGVRLVQDGRWGERLPQLYLVQNAPFCPMQRAWKAQRKKIHPVHDIPDDAHSTRKVYADVLTNRAPPYEVAGGVYDALVATNGEMDCVSASQAHKAAVLLKKTEGIEPDPAAAVALAGLIQGVKRGTILPDKTVLLNITGGGYQNTTTRVQKKPDITLKTDYDDASLIASVSSWVSQYA